MTTTQMLIAVIALIVIAVIALIGLKQLQAKKAGLPKPPSSDKAIRVRQSVPSPDNHELPSPPVQAPNELAKVDELMRHQDYASAIAELKHLLMTNPRHTQAMLKLLQVYGLTKQYSTFHQLHQKICQIADPKTIAEANLCKSLIDEEILSATTPPPKAQLTIGTIEFDTPKPKPVQNAPVQAVPATDDDILELDFNAPAQPSQAVIPNTPSTQTQEGFELEFDFDEPKKSTAPSSDELLILDEPIKPQPTPVATSATDTLATADDFYVSFDTDNTKDTKPNPPHNTQTEDLELDFTLTPLSTATKAKQENTHQLTTTNDDLDFEFDLEPTKTAKTESKQTFDDGLEFGNFDSTIQPTPAEHTPTKTQTTLDDGLDFEFDLSDKTPNKPTPQASTVQKVDLGAMDLTLTAPTQTQETTTTSIGDDGLDFDDFDFGLDKPIGSSSTLQESTTTNVDGLSISLADPAPHKQPPAKTEAFSFDDLSLDLKTSDEAGTPNQNVKTDDFDFGELSLETSKNTDDGLAFEIDSTSIKADGQTSTDEATPKQPSADAFDDGLDFDFGLDTKPATQAQTNSPTNSETNPTVSTTGQVSEFLFELPITPSNEPASEIVLEVVPEVREIPIEISVMPTEQPAITAEPEAPQEIPVEVVVAPVSLEASLTEPQEDSIQTTLTLAQQYCEFGEYDSAKRLLHEVSKNGSVAQQHYAQKLIANLG